MTNTLITSQILSVTNDYILNKMPNRVYVAANTVLKRMMQNAQVVFHGGAASQYPYVDTELNGTYTDAVYDGTVQAVQTPADTDLVGAMHQEAWTYWRIPTSIQHKTRVENTGAWASNEAIINLAKQKEDSLMNAIGAFFEQQILLGDGTSNNLIGFNKLFDITNTNYLGINFTSATTLRPKNVTIATNQNSLTYADLIDAYTDVEDEGQYSDLILSHPDAVKRMRVIAEATVDRTQGGNVDIGHEGFSTLRAKHFTSRYMPTTTSTVIYFMNFGNHMSLGIEGNDKQNVDRGNYFVMEFGGPAPLGFEVSDWKPWMGYEGTLTKESFGALKMACTKPEAQAYISIA